MLRTTLATLAALALLASHAATQTVSASGRLVEPFDAGAVCVAPTKVFQLEHTNVFVTSSTIADLGPFLGADIQATGTLLPGACNLIDASAIAAAPYIVETCGGGALGCPVRIKLHSVGGGTFGLFAALSPGFVPISPIAGSFLLDPAANTLILLGPEPIAGPLTIDAVIPTSPAIFAATIRLQALRAPAGAPGQIRASTVDTVFTGTFTTPCHLPQC